MRESHKSLDQVAVGFVFIKMLHTVKCINFKLLMNISRCRDLVITQDMIQHIA